MNCGICLGPTTWEALWTAPLRDDVARGHLSGIGEAMAEKDYFLNADNEFEEKHGFVHEIVRVLGKLKVEPQRAWANTLFLRLDMIGNSLLLLCAVELRNQKREPDAPSVLDSDSITSIARGLLETWVTF